MSTASPVIKISKPGKSVFSKNIEDFSLNSDYPIAKIGQTIPLDDVGSTSDSSIILSHNQAEDSVILPFVSDDDLNYYLAGQEGIKANFFSLLLGNDFSLNFQGFGVNYYRCFIIADSLFEAEEGIQGNEDNTTSEDVGFKISKELIDVLGINIIRQLQYSSKFEAFKIWKENSGITDISGEYSINHELDFIPTFFVYDEDSWKGSGHYRLNQSSFTNVDTLEVRTTNPNTNFIYKVFANPIKYSSAIIEGNSNYGVKVSKRGANVQDATINNLLFRAGGGTMQIWRRYTIEVAVTEDEVWAEGSVEHDLGFIPAWMHYAVVQGGGLGGSPSGYGIPNGQIFTGFKAVNVEVAVNDTHFYARINASFVPETEVGGSAIVYIWAYEKLL